MPQLDDGRGNLYEQVLEYAKREMDEAASKMEDIKQSLQLLEARVEAAKAVYQAVASRLNLEDEADGAVFDTSYPDAPAPAPEPPPASAGSAPLSMNDIVAPDGPASASESPAAPNISSPASDPAAPEQPPAEPAIPAASSESSDLDIIRQHLAAKAERQKEAPDPPAPESKPEPAAAPTAPEAPAADGDAFSMQLIRQHLEQKAKEQSDPVASTPAPEPVSTSEPEPEAPASGPDAAPGGGLSEADRELIGAYLRSKQN